MITLSMLLSLFLHCAGSGTYCALDLIFDFDAIHVVCLFVSYASTLILFLRFFLTDLLSLQCFDAVGWVAGRASGL